MDRWQWQMVLLCAAFFVTGFLACALLVLLLRDRVLDRHVARCERDIFAPFLGPDRIPDPPLPPPPPRAPPVGRHAARPPAPSIRLDAFDPPETTSRHGSES